MTDRIEPALSAAEWAAKSIGGGDAYIDTDDTVVIQNGHDDARFDAKEAPGIIAFANDILPDSDRRKITREWVDALRDAAGPFMPVDAAEQAARFRSIADALESYLPPHSIIRDGTPHSRITRTD